VIPIPRTRFFFVGRGKGGEKKKGARGAFCSRAHLQRPEGGKIGKKKKKGRQKAILMVEKEDLEVILFSIEEIRPDFPKAQKLSFTTSQDMGEGGKKKERKGGGRQNGGLSTGQKTHRGRLPLPFQFSSIFYSPQDINKRRKRGEKKKEKHNREKTAGTTPLQLLLRLIEEEKRGRGGKKLSGGHTTVFAKPALLSFFQLREIGEKGGEKGRKKKKIGVLHSFSLSKEKKKFLTYVDGPRPTPSSLPKG